MKNMPQQLTIEQALSRAKKATRQGNLSDARQFYEAVLQQQPQHPAALKGLRKLQKSLQPNQTAPARTNTPSQGQINALNDLYNSGQMTKTEQACRELLRTYPRSFIVLNVFGKTLRRQGKLQEAVHICDRAIKVKPDRAKAYYNRGVVLKELGRLEDAIESFDKAIQLESDFAPAYSNRGGALKALGHLEEAARNFEKLIQLEPDSAAAHWNLALTLLLQGNFKDGWREHEWRWGTKSFASQNRTFMQPQWDGSPLDGKTILLHAEQGVGDEVMFSSCVPDLVDGNPKQIILECDLRLAPLFARSFPEVEVQGKRGENSLDWLKEFGDIDFQIAIGGLPRFFRSDFDLFPDRKPFLKPAPELLVKWRSRYAEMGKKMKIGISWRGGGEESKRIIRSIDLQLLEPIFQSGAHFVNLQYGDCAEEINQLERETGVHIHDWDDANPLTNLDDFTAQIAALDLVISIDNSTVHFAGALGVPTWVLLPFVPDWRWMLDRDDSPWYSTMRLFRQKTRGNWSCVFSEVKAELNKYSGLYGRT